MWGQRVYLYPIHGFLLSLLPFGSSTLSSGPHPCSQTFLQADIRRMTTYNEATDLPPPQATDAERDSAEALDEDEIKLVIT